jgi:2-methylcitrate dehydratase
VASRSKFATPSAPSSTFKQFSTMSPLQSGAPPPPQSREYDPEIKDIASYVHNTAINSDLAVSAPLTTVKVRD